MYITKINFTPTNFNLMHKKIGFKYATDTVSFSGKNTGENEYEKFKNNFKTAYGTYSVGEVAYSSIIKPENLIGEGAEKMVYEIPQMEDYVLAFNKKADKKAPLEPFVEYENKLPEYNFSQAIAGNNNELTIMKKVNGTSHSLPDWTKQYRATTYDGAVVSNKDAKMFLNQLGEIETFPLESYVDLASQIKYLADRKVKIDSFSPNNILVDKNAKKFNCIDIMPNSENFSKITPEINGTSDMIAILCDALMQKKYMDALDAKDCAIMQEKTKSVIEKCKKAGKIAGLSDNPSISYETYILCDAGNLKKRGVYCKFTENYQQFVDLYKNIL